MALKRLFSLNVMLKSIIPRDIKTSLKLAVKTAGNFYNGHWFYFAKNKTRDISILRKLLLFKNLNQILPKYIILKKRFNLLSQFI